LVLKYPRREEKLHNAKLHNLHSSQNIVRVTKSGRVIWHAILMGKMRCSNKIFEAKPEENPHLRLLSVLKRYPRNRPWRTIGL
jgi:hypothetical protein